MRLALWLDYIFYRGMRVGKHGAYFRLWKFRTMVRGADGRGEYSIPKDHHLVTKLGRVLRATKLDELPQLINWIKGDITVVGPRPEVAYYQNQLPRKIRDKVLSVKPGVTDVASLQFRNEGELLSESCNAEDLYHIKIWPEKIALQLRYIEHKKFWTDCKIFIATIIICLADILVPMYFRFVKGKRDVKYQPTKSFIEWFSN